MIFGAPTLSAYFVIIVIPHPRPSYYPIPILYSHSHPDHRPRPRERHSHSRPSTPLRRHVVVHRQSPLQPFLRPKQEDIPELHQHGHPDQHPHDLAERPLALGQLAARLRAQDLLGDEVVVYQHDEREERELTEQHDVQAGGAEERGEAGAAEGEVQDPQQEEGDRPEDDGEDDEVPPDRGFVVREEGEAGFLREVIPLDCSLPHPRDGGAEDGREEGE
jgi:hypothetical protein